ncbi:MAG: hypothetical protein B7X51_11160 [Pseudomonas sp. 34-62-33]|nr:MAG: hypothetical protein B7X51_11160 [Pseudomonas sp. 34-62-33]
MDKSILARCLQCGEGIFAKGKKFCSHACYWANGSPLKGTHKPETATCECPNCGKLVTRSPSQKRDGEKSKTLYCNRECYNQYRAKEIAKRAKPCPQCGGIFIFDGKKIFCGERCRREAQNPGASKCKNCGVLFCAVKFRNGVRYRPIRSTCSEQCMIGWISKNPKRKEKISKAFSGENHPMWRGGVSLLSNTSNRGPNWKSQREKAIRRDGEACVHCGMTREDHRKLYASDLNVDHIVPYHNFSSFKKANALDNLQTLCKSCHMKEEPRKPFAQSVLQLVDGGGHSAVHKSIACITNGKLNGQDVLAIRRHAAEGMSNKDIARLYSHKVGTAALMNVIAGKTWKHLLK